MRLDLDLSPQLMLDSLLLHLRLEQDLQRHDGLQLALSRQIHVPELALSQRTPDVEVFYGELPGTADIIKHTDVLPQGFGLVLQYKHLNTLKSRYSQFYSELTLSST